MRAVSTKTARYFGVILLLNLLTACIYQGACTATFEVLAVSIVDASGEPVVDAKVRTLLESNGRTLDTYPDYNPYIEGYELINDNARKVLKRLTSVLLEVERGSFKRSFPYIVKANSCHVESYEGPEIIELE